MAKLQPENRAITIHVFYEGQKDPNGLMGTIKDSEIPVPVMEQCGLLLKESKAAIENSAFDEVRDSGILTELYGNPSKDGEKPNLFSIYRRLSLMANASEEARQQEGYETPRAMPN